MHPGAAEKNLSQNCPAVIPNVVDRKFPYVRPSMIAVFEHGSHGLNTAPVIAISIHTLHINHPPLLPLHSQAQPMYVLKVPKNILKIHL